MPNTGLLRQDFLTLLFAAFIWIVSPATLGWSIVVSRMQSTFGQGLVKLVIGVVVVSLTVHEGPGSYPERLICVAHTSIGMLVIAFGVIDLVVVKVRK